MTLQPAQKQFLPAMQRSAFNAFAPIQREFNRLFEELGSGWGAMTAIDLNVRADLKETKDAVELTLEMPGIAQEDVKITLEDNVLTVSGEKKVEKEEGEGAYHLSERSYGSFARSIALPRNVDMERIDATMSDGLLKITAPKIATPEAKTVQIKGAQPQQAKSEAPAQA